MVAESSWLSNFACLNCCAASADLKVSVYPLLSFVLCICSISVVCAWFLMSLINLLYAMFGAMSVVSIKSFVYFVSFCIACCVEVKCLLGAFGGDGEDRGRLLEEVMGVWDIRLEDEEEEDEEELMVSRETFLLGSIGDEGCRSGYAVGSEA